MSSDKVKALYELYNIGKSIIHLQNIAVYHFLVPIILEIKTRKYYNMKQVIYCK